MSGVVEKLAEVVRRRAAAGDHLAIGRVVRVEGFSTLPAGDDGLVVVDGDGGVEGGALAAMAADELAQAGRNVLASDSSSPPGRVRPSTSGTKRRWPTGWRAAGGLTWCYRPRPRSLRSSGKSGGAIARGSSDPAARPRSGRSRRHGPCVRLGISL